MIEINLLPEEKRAKMRAAAQAAAKTPSAPASEQLKKLVYLVPLAAVVLLAVHAYLAMAQVTSAARYAGLQKRLASFQPQMKNITGFKSMFEAKTRDERVMQELAKGTVDWSRKLNRLSIDLPAGVWINDLTVSRRQMVLRCSVVSLDENPMELINNFLSALKNDPDFFSDFSSFDLGTVQKRMLGSYEVADFTVTMEVKQ